MQKWMKHGSCDRFTMVMVSWVMFQKRRTFLFHHNTLWWFSNPDTNQKHWDISTPRKEIGRFNQCQLKSLEYVHSWVWIEYSIDSHPTKGNISSRKSSHWYLLLSTLPSYMECTPRKFNIAPEDNGCKTVLSCLGPGNFSGVNSLLNLWEVWRNVWDIPKSLELQPRKLPSLKLT